MFKQVRKRLARRTPQILESADVVRILFQQIEVEGSKLLRLVFRCLRNCLTDSRRRSVISRQQRVDALFFELGDIFIKLRFNRKALPSKVFVFVDECLDHTPLFLNPYIPRNLFFLANLLLLCLRERLFLFFRPFLFQPIGLGDGAIIFVADFRQLFLRALLEQIYAVCYIFLCQTAELFVNLRLGLFLLFFQLFRRFFSLLGKPFLLVFVSFIAKEGIENSVVLKQLREVAFHLFQCRFKSAFITFKFRLFYIFEARDHLCLLLSAKYPCYPRKDFFHFA